LSYPGPSHPGTRGWVALYGAPLSEGHLIESRLNLGVAREHRVRPRAWPARPLQPARSPVSWSTCA